MATSTTMGTNGRGQSTKSMNIIYWVVAIVVVLGLVWFLAFKNVPNSPAPTVDQPAGTVNTMEPRAGEIGSSGAANPENPAVPARTNDTDQR